MKSTVVKIAGKSYTVQELPRRHNMQWRKDLSGEFSELVQVLTVAPDLEIDSAEGLTQVGNLVRLVVGKLAGSVDTVVDHLFAYSPALANDREHIEAEGYESELIDAFVKVLGLAFPFGSLVDLAAGAMRKAGQQGSPTSTS